MTNLLSISSFHSFISWALISIHRYNVFSNFSLRPPTTTWHIRAGVIGPHSFTNDEEEEQKPRAAFPRGHPQAARCWDRTTYRPARKYQKHYFYSFASVDLRSIYFYCSITIGNQCHSVHNHQLKTKKIATAWNMKLDSNGQHIFYYIL